jgi:hypothetical protein
LVPLQNFWADCDTLSLRRRPGFANYKLTAKSTKAAISGGLSSSAMNFDQLFSLLARFHDMNSPIVEPAPDDDELAAGAL